MGLRFRRSVGAGPLRLSVSRSGVTPGLRLGPLTLSTRGWSFRLGGGVSYGRRWSGRRHR